MTIEVDFTGTPLSGSASLSVAFTSSVTVTADGGGGNARSKKKKRGRVIHYSDFEARERYEKELREAIEETVVITPASSIPQIPREDALIASETVWAFAEDLLAKIKVEAEDKEMLDALMAVIEIDERIH